MEATDIRTTLDSRRTPEAARLPLLTAQLEAQLVAWQARAAAAEAVLDNLAAAVFTLDVKGQVLRANRKGEAILSAPDGLSLHDNRLHCARTRETEQLHAAVVQAAAASPGGGVGGSRTLAISRPSMRRPFGVVVAPLRGRDVGQPPLNTAAHRRAAAVLVTVSDPEDAVQPPIECLTCLFKLTQAEARLASALTARQTIEGYAERAGISRGTARWTLKRVMEKTGCRRQSELVLLLATSVAALFCG